MRSNAPARLRARLATTLLTACATVLLQPAAQAFCGFYVSQASGPLYNEASKVVLAWDDGRITVTMASDYHGDAREFGLVIPVPVVVQREDIRVVGMDLVDKLDAYTQPRLTEYYDPDPCPPEFRGMVYQREYAPMPPPLAAAISAPAGVPKVAIEAQYQVGVYDIEVLKAEESAGLVDYLTTNGYRIPDGAAPVLASYIAQNMHFFLAKVNLDRQKAAGESFLRPIQVSYRSPKFMLPLRLGTVNASGPQDLLVFALTRHGRVESVNYRTAKAFDKQDLPVYARDQLHDIYHAAFDRRVRQDQMSNVYTEYAWSLSTYCDPCSAPKPDSIELYTLGASWQYPQMGNVADPTIVPPLQPVAETGFITRLHLRYDRAHFPEDLALQETADDSPYQVVFSIHHPFTGAMACAAAGEYKKQLQQRYAAEAGNLQALTGWNHSDIVQQMAQSGEAIEPRRSLFKRIADVFSP
jgi:hypothetical protein